MTDLSPPPAAQSVAASSRFRPSWWWLAPLAAAVILLYYPVGMALVHEIDDDPDFAPPAGSVQAEQSRAVATAALLVRREVDLNRWTPNDPFFQPTWALDDMPAFQQGIVAAVSRFAVVMSDAIGRPRNGGGVDQDLDRAAGLFKYPGTVWMFDPSTSWAPTASSEKQYRLASRWLDGYNIRLGNGEAVFEKRPEALKAMVDGIVRDLDAAAAIIDRQLAANSLIDFQADNVFYATKGRIYAYSLLMRELGWDYAPVLAERELGGPWRAMLDSLRAAAALGPLVVVNGAPDSNLLPSHLAAQGYTLMRARAQLAEIADILVK